MYEAFFGLNQRPFNMTPDPEFLIFTDKHREAFAHLVYGINQRRGFVVITGEVGAGKTTLCRALLNEFDERIKIALVLNPFLSDIDLLRTINEELFINAKGQTKKELLDTLYAFLIDQHARGVNVVLVIDEAQNIPEETLEQIRIISNLETVKDKLIQIVLVGQPELRDKLACKRLRQLNQRVTVRYHLCSMDRRESGEYVLHRLRVAGATPERPYVTREALDVVYRYTGGVPRRINALCDQALLAAYVAETTTIDREIVVKARKELNGGVQIRAFLEDQRSLLRAAWAVAASAMFALVVGAAVSKYSSPDAEAGLTQAEVRPAMELALALAPLEPPPADLVTFEVAAPQDVQDVVVDHVPAQPEQEVAMIGDGIGDEADDWGDDRLEGAWFEAWAALDAGDRDLEGPTLAHAALVWEREDDAPYRDDEGASEIWVATGEFDAAGVMRCAMPEETYATALATAMSRLGFAREDLTAAAAMPSAETALLGLAEHRGLALVDVALTAAKLRRLGLPAVLELAGAEGERLYVACWPDGEGLALADPLHGLQPFDADWITDHWYGRALVFCPDEAHAERPMGVGVASEEVRRVQGALNTLGLFDGALDGYFNHATREAVEAFQRRNFLRVDGVVGRETALFLYAAHHDHDAQEVVQ